MLDTDTKRRIDTARDILVGKVPDPKSQVEQSTIALIYKFMHDMDSKAEALGGERTFFKGEFAPYAWSHLMSPALGGHEVLNLYSAAIQQMNVNPNIPPLFRDIFKNAFLPYRDPETLKSFLKVINEFHYDHSEKLGDAFEYLLSVLGSQGEAGQFRTPRHIIDFIVDVVDPHKEDRILDVACGTAGFLISAYKHILKNNSSNYKSDLLTPENRKRLAENMHGYDISPDMVRLSLVNMYLHSIQDPHIIEYDSLTSEERWNDYFDVILANPPFMSPKGGIRPHKRFSVLSKRSEVLFVDYIAEHLLPNGRAGVFNPYSGVKTSILLLDKQLNKKKKNILFVKINNDGYDLGAQRRPIAKNDLPGAAALLKEYIDYVRDNRRDAPWRIPAAWQDKALLVEKIQLAESGEFNLSSERYKDTLLKNHNYPLVELGNICELLDGKRVPISKSDRKKGPFPYYGASGIVDYVEKYLFNEELLLLSEDGANLLTRSSPIAFSVSGKIWVNNHAQF